MKKNCYEIIIFALVSAAVQIYCVNFTASAYAGGNSAEVSMRSAAPASQAPAGGKIPVYEAALKYCKMWDKSETEDVMKYQPETSVPDEKTLKMLGDKLGGGFPAYEVMLAIADGLPAMFKPATKPELEFVVKNFSNASVRSAVKMIAGGAKFLQTKGKFVPASRVIFTACLMVMDFESAMTAVPAGQGPLMTKMISAACRKICLETLVRIILNGDFNEKYYLNFCKTLDFIDGSQIPLSKTMEIEKNEIIKTVKVYASLDADRVREIKDPIYPPEVFAIVSAEIKKSPFAVKVAGLYADEAVSQIDGIFLKYGEALKKPFKEASAIFDAIDGNFRDGKYNNFFTQVTMPNMGRANWQNVRVNVISDMAKTAALLKLYKSSKKKFPEKLSDIDSAAAGVKIPKDIFSGQDFFYRRIMEDGFILASTGQNMRLDGEYNEKFDQSGDRLTSSDDIVMTEKYISAK